MVTITTPEKFIKVLHRIDKIADPNEKYSLMTIVLPQLLEGKDRILANPQQKASMESALLKTALVYAEQRCVRQEKSDARWRRIATLGGTLCLAGLAVKEYNWSKWNPLTYLFSYWVQQAFNPAVKLVCNKEFFLANHLTITGTMFTAALAVKEGHWSAYSLYTYLFSFGLTLGSEILGLQLKSFLHGTQNPVRTIESK